MPPLPMQSNKEIQELIKIIDGAEEALSELDEPPPVVELTDEEPSSLAERLGDLGYERYAQVADQAYKDDRIDVDNYGYVPDLSTDDHGVYESDSEVVIGVRGTSPKTPFRDLARDVQIALGSAGSILAPLAAIGTLSGPLQPLAVIGSQLDPLGEGVRDLGEVVDRIKKEKPGKKIHVTGHSLGGTIASLYGVQNQDVDISTFNKGEGLPFLDSTMRCTISGCKNISNYRIAGDFASLGSKLSNVGEYRTLAPVRPTPEVQEEATLAGGFFIEPELYLPHSVSNFIGRSSKKELSSDIYARPLAGKIGRVAGATLPIVAGALYNKYLDSLSIEEREDFLDIPRGSIDQRVGELFSSDAPANPVGLTRTPSEVDRAVGSLQEIAADEFGASLSAIRPFKATLSNLASGSFLGRSAGELAGLAFYEAFLAE